jgi:SHS family lactate transporter-like MFS transporter
MFPPGVRARLVGIVYHAGAALAALVPTATAALAAWAHVSLGFAIFAVASACEVVLAIAVVAGRRFASIPGSADAAAASAPLEVA